MVNHRDQPASRATAMRWSILLLLTMMVCLGHFNRVSISVAGNERFIENGRIDRESMGQIYTVFLLVYTACMLPAGWFIDRVGPATALTWMALGLGLCVIMTGVVGWQSESAGGLWLSLMIVRGVAGAASSPLHPAAARSVSLWFPAGTRIRANGFVTAGALVGIAVTYPVFGWLMDRFDWPWAFVICGSATMAFAVVWRCVATDGANDHRWTSVAQRAPVPRSDEPAQSQPKSPSRSVARDLLGLLRHRGLVLLSISYAAVGYFQYLFFYWIENYFSDTLHLPVEESRRASSAVMIAMAAGMACGGWAADSICRRWGQRYGRRAMAFGGMTLSALFALLGVATNEPDQVVAWFSLALASLGACEGVFWTTVTDMGGRGGGLAAAVLNTLGNAGGALAPWLTAVLIDRFDWHIAIGVACAICGLGATLWFGFDPTMPIEPNVPHADNAADRGETTAR
ncbi:MAG: MFS transporter [Pirellulales bacterium]